MALYKKLVEAGSKYVGKHILLKYGLNLSPMYRRSTGRVLEISKDLMKIRIKIPISYKNRNYVGSIFGGSMFSAVDPFPMVQLVNLLGDDYVVWDKSAEIFFKRPAMQDLYATFLFTVEELQDIKNRVGRENEIEIVKTTALTDKNQTAVYCQVNKTIFIADKFYYKEKRRKRKEMSSKKPT